MLNFKQSGFKRSSPHEESVPKLKELKFSCKKCKCTLESQGMLNAHMETHKQSGYKCEKCKEIFTTEVQFENHMKTDHNEEVKIKTKQYNCEDCPFQGENGVELKKHVQRTSHNPSECTEECYTCKKEFVSYWHLMNHRRTEHPSNKLCRYFQDESCRFDAETCWYKHENKVKPDSGKLSNTCKCTECEHIFSDKGNLMKHMKTDHPKIVPMCRNFLQGNCNLSDNSCWFNHEKDDRNMNVEENELNNSVFHMAPEKIPPDQISLLMTMIKKLSLQVENLEKITQNMK